MIAIFRIFDKSLGDLNDVELCCRPWRVSARLRPPSCPVLLGSPPFLPCILKTAIIAKGLNMKYSENGWLFQSGELQNITRDVTEDDLFALWQLSEDDDAWSKRVHEEVILRDGYHNKRASDFLVDEIRIINVGGTVVSFPYGDIITFPSKRHLFRGERKQYPRSVPSLNREIENRSPRYQELYRVIANMRIEQFCKFLWQLNIVPYWEAKLSDVNYKALAQHYGYQTQLLDLTNDFRTALFFATCRYDYDTDSYLPLTETDISDGKESQYGVIFHTPDWRLDFLQPSSLVELGFNHPELFQMRLQSLSPDSKILDGMAFQIGFQPLQRCHCQHGYLMPMHSGSLQEDIRFEKLRFPQSTALSKRVFDLMEGGKKIFPHDGISKANDILRKMQHETRFSEDDLLAAYEYWETDKTLFPTIDALRDSLLSMELKDGNIEIFPEDIDYHISQQLLNEINQSYDPSDLYRMIGGMIHIKPEQKERRNQRCIQIYGTLLE